MSTITYIVKVASGKFTIDDAVAPKLTFRDGDTYIFDQSDASNSGHTLQFSITSNNSGSSEYTTGVTKTGTAGQAGAKTTIVTSSSTTDTLYYYSSGGGTYGEEFSNTGFNTSANYNVLKPIIGGENTAEKWGSMVNHAIDQIDLQTKDNRDYTDQHAYQGEPHIIPDTLYPAWSGLLDNHTGYTFTDSSASAHTITVAGDVHHTGSQKKVGNTTLNFNGGHLNMPDSSDWDMAGGEFTIEYWFRGDVTSNLMHLGQNSSAGIVRSLVEAQSGTPKIVAYYYGSSAQALISTTTFVANTWYHVAIVRNNSGTDAVNLFINGTQEATIAPNADMANDGAVLSIGAFGTYVAQNHLGYMDEIRIIKGTCAYTGNFTPPTALTTTGGTYSSATNVNTSITASHTKLLLHSEAGGHVGAYGTAQSDGRMYFYTDIKGSKPIKDPRIGSHFGSQRHKFKSLQKLEQETATHGANVYSVDGREWLRAVGTVSTEYGDHTSSRVNLGADGSFFEITGYFNDANFLLYAGTNSNSSVVLNGGTAESNTGATASVASPLGGRYVDNSSLINLVFDTTPVLGINTIKIIDVSSHVIYATGIELIAQDTTSTANKSKVQIPSQNVVSYGKKFTVSGTPHYDPFNGFTNGSSVTAYVDTATSLGVEAWKNSSTYYRPYNGGRVVKWVASDGTIKTSVNMMPPNAQNIAGSAISAKANASVANDTYLPTFSGAIDNSQAEVAKTFNWREFGNGSANGGTGATYADASMLNATDAIAYVMDDGLTSLSANSHYWSESFGLIRSTTNKEIYMTFIGTGLSFDTGPHASANGWNNVVQNLPYGTHILEIHTDASNSDHGTWKIDGVTIRSFASASPAMYHQSLYGDISFHQPKMPPIPEDAVIVADFMLMADFVAKTPAVSDATKISKGVRLISGSRDIFYDSAGSVSTSQNMKPLIESWVGNIHGGFAAYFNGATNQNSYAQLPYFGTTDGEFSTRGVGDSAKVTVSLTNSSGTLETSNVTLTSNTTISSQPTIPEGGSDTANNHTFTKSDGVLGLNTVKFLADGAGSTTNLDWLYFGAMSVHSPIHTSSHYQTFETPFLRELVGGDRNMEQNNLIVTPDGKTWDEVTRKTDYLSNTSLVVKNGSDTWNSDQFWSIQRGVSSNLNMMSKEWISGYDRWICLKEGHYQIGGDMLHRHSAAHIYLYLNGNIISKIHTIANASDHNIHSVNAFNTIFEAKRGDYMYITGERHGASWSTINIKRI